MLLLLRKHWPVIVFALLCFIGSAMRWPHEHAKLLLFLGALCILILPIDFLLHQKVDYSKLKLRNTILVILSLGISLFLRFLFFDFESGDYTGNVRMWYETLDKGGFMALKESFHGYPPIYLYFIYFATLIPIPQLWAIKLFSVAFDYILAYYAYKLLRLKFSSFRSYAAAMVILLFPTVLTNSAMWAQCDSMHTAGLIAALYYFASDKPNKGMLAFAFAFMFKFQAVFMILIPVVFYLKGKIQLKHFLYIPLVFFLMVLPNWLIGRPLLEMFFVYGLQATTFGMLSQFAPSVWQFFAWASVPLFSKVATSFTLSLIALYSLWYYVKKPQLSFDFILDTALLSTLIIPFFMPFMHDRYFYPADVLAIIYAFRNPKQFAVPFLVGLSSFFAYLYFLIGGLELFPFKFLALAMLVAIILVAKKYVADYIFPVKPQKS